MSVNTLSDCLEKFRKVTKKPTKFLSVQDDICEDIKELSKLIYDFTKHEEDVKRNSDALPELIVKEFDEEQIWQEIELQNNSQWDGFIESVASLMSNTNILKFPIKEKESCILSDEEASYESTSETSDTKIPESTKYYSKGKKRSEKKVVQMKREDKQSIVDDDFFKLNEMERFLEIEDKKEMSELKAKRKQQDSDEESIDLFEPSDDEDDEDTDNENENNYNIKYEDFFGDGTTNEENGDVKQSQADCDSENEDDIEESGEDTDRDECAQLENEIKDTKEDKIDRNKKSVRFNIQDSQCDGNSDKDRFVYEQTETVKKPEHEMSEYELRQKRLRDKIRKLEEKNLSDKPWQMKGEVTAASRPQNSLLEEVLDFDMTSRPAPIITEETTLKLEDIIKQRMKDKVWDDVVRKEKPIPETHGFKKSVILDQEKSKISLAQVYEQEYLKQKRSATVDEDQDEEEPDEHKKIKKSMESLFAKLDALSNYHYTPKPAQAEVKIVSNIPAISMEEVAPVATSDAALLAPEEVKAKLKGDLMAKNERTDTDKKRERRKKKKLQRDRQKEKTKKENLINKLNPGLGNKYSKEKTSEILDKITKESKITSKMPQLNDSKSLKSSKAFFTQLNEDVSCKKIRPKKNKELHPAKKYKL